MSQKTEPSDETMDDAELQAQLKKQFDEAYGDAATREPEPTSTSLVTAPWSDNYGDHNWDMHADARRDSQILLPNGNVVEGSFAKTKYTIPTKRTERKVDDALTSTNAITGLSATDPLRELFFILRLVRCTDSNAETTLIHYIEAELSTLAKERKHVFMWRDRYDKSNIAGNGGNIHCKVKPNNDDNRIIFSSHIDTVAGNKGDDLQTLMVDPIRQEVFVPPEAECLGADDGVGVWIMLNMIKHDIPGYYIFHRDEEVGGLGSSWLATHGRTKLEPDYDAVIAFDRKDYRDIITHQGRRTCSEQFALELAGILNAADKSFEFEPSNRGTFTDSANYAGFISECTNVSVGYFLQHGPNEYLDYGFAEKLMEATLKAEWSALSAYRKPEEEYYSKKYSGGSYTEGGVWTGRNGSSSGTADINSGRRHWDATQRKWVTDPTPGATTVADGAANEEVEEEVLDIELTTAEDWDRIVESVPDLAAFVLESMQINSEELVQLMQEFWNLDDETEVIKHLLSLI